MQVQLHFLNYGADFSKQFILGMCWRTCTKNVQQTLLAVKKLSFVDKESDCVHLCACVHVGVCNRRIFRSLRDHESGATLTIVGEYPHSTLWRALTTGQAVCFLHAPGYQLKRDIIYMDVTRQKIHSLWGIKRRNTWSDRQSLRKHMISPLLRVTLNY